MVALGVFLACGAALWLGQDEPVAFALLTLAVVTAAVSPAGAFLATCAAIPLVFKPVMIGDWEFSLLELGIVTSAVGLALHVGGRLLSRSDAVDIRRLLTPLPTTLFVAALVGVGLLSLSAVGDSHRFDGSFRFFRWTVVEPVMLFAIARFVRQQRGEAILGLALVVPAIVVSLHAISQAVAGDGGFAVDSTFRSVGPYLHPNNLALYLERPLLVVLALVIGGSASGRRWAIPMTLVLFLGVAVTLSRGAVLGLGCGLLVMLVVMHVRRAGLLALGAVFVFAGAISLISVERLVGASSSGIIAGRLPIWSAALKMIRDFPFRGIGLDQFLFMHGTRYMSPEEWSERYVSHPHNAVLDVWLSFGVLGLVLLAAGIAGLLLRARTIRDGGTMGNTWQIGAIAALAGGLAHGLVDNVYFLPDLAAMTLILVVAAERGTDPRHGPAGEDAAMSEWTAPVILDRGAR